MNLVTPADRESTPFEALGGESGVRELVGRFYDLMDLESEYRALRALHPTSLDRSRERLFWFLCGWMGGPQLYAEKVGQPMLRARHLHVAIGSVERDLWLACMARALDDVGANTSLVLRLRDSFFATADWMRNRPEVQAGTGGD